MPTKSERAQLAGQIWAMDERCLRSLLASIPAEIRASPGEMAVAMSMRKTKDGASYSVSNNVATIPIKGVILKSVPWYFEWLGIDAVSTDALTEQVRSAANDPDVHGIRFDVDSPGGTVDGVQELASTIRSASAAKPTSASVSNLCASAAYWLASQTQAIDAHPAAEVGSIGVYSVLDDFSAMYEEAGIKTHVVSSHPLKGTGVEGAPITDAQLADVKRMIDGYADLFVADVSRGRNGKMSREQIEKHATGQTWLGKEALSAGLVDSVRGDETASTQTNAPMMGAQPAAVAAAATPAAEVTTMTPEEIVKLQVDNEAKAREIDALKTAQRKAVMDKHADKIAPAQRANVEQMANALADAEKLDAILATWPTLTRPERVSDAGAVSVTEPDVDPEDAQFIAAATKPLVGKAKVAKIMGMSVEDVEFYSHVKGFTHENGGQFIFEDGQTRHTLKRDELQALHAEVKQARTTGPLAARIAGGLRKIGVVMGIVLALFAGVDAQAGALSAARNTECRGTGNTRAYLMTVSQTIYKGGFVMLVTAGTAQAASAVASNHNIVGIAQETKTSAASGSYWINVTDNIICKFAGTTLAQTGVGLTVYAEDDQTVDETVGSNEPVAGILVQYVSASVGWVYVSSLVNQGRVAVTQPLTLTADLTLENAEIIDNGTDDEICLIADAASTSAEDLCFDVDGTNKIDVKSNTSVGEVDFNAIDIISDKYGFDTTAEYLDSAAGMICMNGSGGANNEDVCFDFETTANAIEISSNTAAAAVDFNAINLISDHYETDTGEFMDSGAGTMCFNGAGGANNEDVCWDLETAANTAGITTNTGVTKIDFNALNIETDGTLQVLGSGATIGWTAASAANTACATTCAGTGACVFGYDVGGAVMTACNDAAADTCVCAGPAS